MGKRTAVSTTPVATTPMSDEERIEVIRALHVNHKETDDCFSLFDRLVARSRQLPEPRCLMLIGDTGLGKSTILRKYRDKRPSTLEDNCIIRPILYVSLPVKATILATATAMLDALETPGSEKGTQISRTKRVEQQLRIQRVEIVLVDETQHVVEASGEKTLYKVGDFFKDLAKKTGIPFVLAGMPSTRGMALGNPQLLRLTNIREIRPYSWRSDPEFVAFRKFLAAIDTRLPFEERSKLGEADLSREIFVSTDGVMSNVMDLVREAAISAVIAGHTKIEREDLWAAFDATLVGKNQAGHNPFSVD